MKHIKSLIFLLIITLIITISCIIEEPIIIEPNNDEIKNDTTSIIIQFDPVDTIYTEIEI